MYTKQLPENMQQELNKWFDREVTPSHIWEVDKTYMVLVLIDNDIFCLRLWESPFTNAIQLSQDNIISRLD